MSLFFLLFTFLGGLFFSLTGFDIASSQAQARDAERKNDINSIYQKLEEHYSVYSDYPTEEELAVDYDQKLPLLDPQSLIDPHGQKIQQGEYLYKPSGCNAIGCAHYTISAQLEDGSIYTKESLN